MEIFYCLSCFLWGAYCANDNSSKKAKRLKLFLGILVLWAIHFLVKNG